ncbi:MAG TPA: hypothetical protein VLZ74_06045, partial [Methylocella sp.]|nr:hypothetical protein [Methylocella sp.]
FDARGGDRSKSEVGLTFATSRAQAAENAGLSRHQALTAVRIAAIDEDEFENRVESDNPPGTSILAQVSKSTRCERVSPITPETYDRMRQRHAAAKALDGLLHLERSSRETSVTQILDFIAQGGAADEMKRIQLGLNFATALNNALGKTRPGFGKPSLKPVE